MLGIKAIMPGMCTVIVPFVIETRLVAHNSRDMTLVYDLRGIFCITTIKIIPIHN